MYWILDQNQKMILLGMPAGYDKTRIIDSILKKYKGQEDEIIFIRRQMDAREFWLTGK